MEQFDCESEIIMCDIDTKIANFAVMAQYADEISKIIEKLKTAMDELDVMVQFANDNGYEGGYKGKANDDFLMYHAQTREHLVRLNVYLEQGRRFIYLCLEESIKEDAEFKKVMSNLPKMLFEER